MDNTRGNLEFEILASFYRMWKSTLDLLEKLPSKLKMTKDLLQLLLHISTNFFLFLLFFFNFLQKTNCMLMGPIAPQCTRRICIIKLIQK